ncbi:hypothetical protein DCC84_05120 [Pseudomonas sp. SXM-1]|nr:hypothetical protein DCC84_05120 [Pseudomonas sp. SXM-1]
MRKKRPSGLFFLLGKTPLFLFGNPTNVGAGLPAMASPRSGRYTESPASQASQLPHLTEFDQGMCDNTRHF